MLLMTAPKAASRPPPGVACSAASGCSTCSVSRPADSAPCRLTENATAPSVTRTRALASGASALAASACVHVRARPESPAICAATAAWRKFSGVAPAPARLTSASPHRSNFSPNT
jgi:hypothetical protein